MQPRPMNRGLPGRMELGSLDNDDLYHDNDNFYHDSDDFDDDCDDNDGDYGGFVEQKVAGEDGVG